MVDGLFLWKITFNNGVVFYTDDAVKANEIIQKLELDEHYTMYTNTEVLENG